MPKLMALLQERYDDMAEGETLLVTIRGGWIQERAKRAVARVGIELWDGLFQTLRASCEQEWAMTLPQYAVSNWIGHSITVSGKHYTNAVPDELFDNAAQNQAQQLTEVSRNELHAQSATPKESHQTAWSSKKSLEMTGGEGIRTLDLGIANAALSQLSYAPCIKTILYRSAATVTSWTGTRSLALGALIGSVQPIP